jgi:hypothetical protein
MNSLSFPILAPSQADQLVRLAAGARSRGTVASELAPRRRGPLDNSEADRRRPTRAVQVDSDSTSKSYSNGFRHDRPTRTPTDSGLHRRCDPHKAPLSPQSDGEAAPGPQLLAEDRDDTAGNLTQTLGMRWRTLHRTGMPPKPRSCNGSREKAQCRRPGRRAGSPLRLETLGLPRRGRPYPAGALPLGLSQVGLGLICTAPGGIAPRSPCERDSCSAPLSPSMGLGKPRTGCSSHDIPLGAARPSYWPAQHVQTQLPTRPAADSRHSGRMTTADSDNGPGLATGPPSHRREDRPHIKPSEEPDRLTTTGTTVRRANHGPTR